jgi:hypothetical protein
MVVSGQGAVVFVPRWWNEGDIATMLGALGLHPRRARVRSRSGTRTRGSRFSVRRPVVFTVGTLVGSLGYLFLLTYLVLQF